MALRRKVKMEIIKLNINEVIPYPDNPRKNDNAVDAVAESIKQCGYCSPIVIDEDNVILAGHTRLKALKKLKWKEVECVRKTGLTEEQKKKYRILDNKTNELAEWDFNILDAALAELDFDDFDFGFDTQDLSVDDFGEDFSLPDGDKGEICQMTFTLHNEQAELIKYAISVVGECSDTFGNTNKNGNALYEVVRQWAEQRK